MRYDGLQTPDTLISAPFVFAHEAEVKMKEEKYLSSIWRSLFGSIQI